MSDVALARFPLGWFNPSDRIRANQKELEHV